jgi:hypothetical protein
MFKLFPELIAFYIDSNDRQASSEATLADERKTAELPRAIRRGPRSRSSQPARFNRRRGATSNEEALDDRSKGNRRDDAKWRGTDERANQ